jgi:hypothetical protein
MAYKIKTQKKKYQANIYFVNGDEYVEGEVFKTRRKAENWASKKVEDYEIEGEEVKYDVDEINLGSVKNPNKELKLSRKCKIKVNNLNEFFR